jgi:hypothetical protein
MKKILPILMLTLIITGFNGERTIMLKTDCEMDNQCYIDGKIMDALIDAGLTVYFNNRLWSKERPLDYADPQPGEITDQDE